MKDSGPVTSRPGRTARLGLRATAQQEELLRRGAEVSRKSLTEFILDSACAAAEQALLHQRLFLADERKYQAFVDLLNRPARSKAGLARLMKRKAPWER